MEIRVSDAFVYESEFVVFTSRRRPKVPLVIVHIRYSIFDHDSSGIISLQRATCKIG